MTVLFLHTASEKLDTNGVKIVLESDGTEIDEDEPLLHFKDEVLILLESGESWREKDQYSTDSLCSKDSLFSKDSLSSKDSLYEKDSLHDANINKSNEEYNWTSFEIPYHKIPKDMLAACEKGERNKHIITVIVHIIINELRQIKELIPIKVLRMVADKLRSKFPKMFTDLDEDGNVVGDGYGILFFKLCERATYLRRPHKRLNAEPIVPRNFIKRKVNAMAGCIAWSKTINENNVTAANTLNTMESLPSDTNTLHALLEEAYPQHRSFFNRILHPPTVLQIKTEQPLFLNKDVIYWHFEKLTNKNLHSLLSNMEEKAEKIIGYGCKKSFLDPNDIKIYNKIQCTLIFLSKYFKEDLSALWCTVKVSTH